MEKYISNPTKFWVVCAENAIESPLNLIYDSGYAPQDLESLDQDQMNSILLNTVRDEQAWSTYSMLFDKKVTKNSAQVTQMRINLVLAGPLQYMTG